MRAWLLPLFCLLVILILPAVSLPGGLRPAAAAPFPNGAWVPTGSMMTARAYHTANQLADGRVLVAGGYTDSPLDAAELYDPAAGEWTATDSLSTGRHGHTATRLADGRILVAGGAAAGNVPLASVERYDPAVGEWIQTGGMQVPRQIHAAALLLDGKVLVAGGHNNQGNLVSAELYDPATEQWTVTGGMVVDRRSHLATTLVDGRVLVEGGLSQDNVTASAEIYDPDTEEWTLTGSMADARYGHTATLLPDGRVLVVGGTWSWGYPNPLSTVEVYDPATGSWMETGALHSPRLDHGAALLPDGRVLVAGGLTLEMQVDATAEVYDPVTGQWTWAASLNTGRSSYSLTPLLDGRLLAAAGTYWDGSGWVSLDSAELYDPAAGTAMFVQLVHLVPIEPTPALRLVLGLVRIVDEGHAPVAGATIDLEWTLPFPYTIPRSRLTNANGLAMALMLGKWPGTYELCVMDMTAPGYFYDPDQNWETCAAITQP